MTHSRRPVGCAGLVAFALLLTAGFTAAEDIEIEGLDEPVSIVYDVHDVPTVFAKTEHDAIFMQGYLHARERLFQMDYTRRGASGTLAEMLGTAALPSDIELRTIGLRRAAERSAAVQTPEVNAWLEAYADGVNALLADESIPLPPEYGPLELTRAGIPPWTPLDSLTTAKGLAAQLDFDLEDITRTIAVQLYDAVGAQAGFFGLFLFLNDLWRQAPFEPEVTVPPMPSSATSPDESESALPSYLDERTLRLARSYRDKAIEVPFLRRALEFSQNPAGSNWWVVGGDLTESGYPMLANDPHLGLGTPATFYEVHLVVEGGMNVAGISLPGLPGVLQGCTDTICWGTTVNYLDVTDVFQEVLVALPTPGLPPGTPSATIFEGVPEPMLPIPQSYSANFLNGMPDSVFPVPVPPANSVVFTVPRRNFGPILAVDASDPALITGFSVQWVGFVGTQELEGIRRFTFAESPEDFREALQFFDSGSQNWAYADIHGNIAYYTSGELPIREDFQLLNRPAAARPPFFIRDGTHTFPHEWLQVTNPQPHQVLNREILPFDEMPQVVNPASGYILNGNNDPIGTTFDNSSFNQLRVGGQGLLYLSPGYAPGFRMGRIRRLFDQILATGDGKLSLGESIGMAANHQMLDAEVLLPYLLAAFDNAQAEGAWPPLAGLGADPGVVEAIGRLAQWDFSTPTGIPEGYDPGDNPLALPDPTPGEIQASIAATLYSVWRGQFVYNVIDAVMGFFPLPPPFTTEDLLPPDGLAMSALRNMLDNWDAMQGFGSSGLNFFFIPGSPDQATSRDLKLLGALRSALDLLASEEFAPAFGMSTNQDDYRWGKLHRVVFEHLLGVPFSIPPRPPVLNDLSPELPGLARSGGFGVVDASRHDVRANGLNEFMFENGPNRRVQAILTPAGPQVLEVIPGGQSGIIPSPFQLDQLLLWLVHGNKPLPIAEEDVAAAAVRSEQYVPEPPLLVVLESLSADVTADGVVVRWTTSLELDTVGFRVLRAKSDGEKVSEPVILDVIPSRGSALGGADYRMVDRKAPNSGLIYYLEDIDTRGTVTRHGPVFVDNLPVARKPRASKR